MRFFLSPSGLLSEFYPVFIKFLIVFLWWATFIHKYRYFAWCSTNFLILYSELNRGIILYFIIFVIIKVLDIFYFCKHILTLKTLISKFRCSFNAQQIPILKTLIFKYQYSFNAQQIPTLKTLIFKCQHHFNAQQIQTYFRTILDAHSGDVSWCLYQEYWQTPVAQSRVSIAKRRWSLILFG